MEKKNMDKIDTLYDYVENNRDKLEERIHSLEESLYTNDMIKILETIKQYNPYYEIHISQDNINYDIRFWNGSTFRLRINYEPLSLNGFRSKQYNNKAISYLESEIQAEKILENQLSIIEDNMEEIISNISSKYKTVSEKEGDALDNLLNQINYDTTPTKHLKITVEWV